MKRMLSVIFIVIFIILIAASACLFFSDKLLAFSVDALTPWKIEYQKWGTSLLDKRHITGLKLILEDKGLIVQAAEADVELNVEELLRKRKLHVNCRMKDVVLRLKGAEETYLEGDITDVVFSPGQLFGHVSFNFIIDAEELSVTSIEARSEDIRISGDYTSFKKKDDISVDIKISLSPRIAENVQEDIRKNILTQDEGGWYTAIINYKGNPAFLKALYSLASP